MITPVIHEAARRLDALLGVWAVSGTMTSREGVVEVSGRWQFSRVAGGHGIRTTLQTAIEGMGSFVEEELIGFDPGEGKIHLFSLNQFAVRDHVGAWKSDRVLYVEYVGDQGGKRNVEGITITIEGDRMKGEVLETLAGEVIATTSLTFSKVGGIG